jgi:hypothetical protein
MVPHWAITINRYAPETVNWQAIRVRDILLAPALCDQPHGLKVPLLPQVPRLTAVLRGLSKDPASSFDPDAAFIQRQKTVAARQQLQQQSGGAAGGQQGVRSKLAQQLIGDWRKGKLIMYHSPDCRSPVHGSSSAAHTHGPPEGHGSIHNSSACVSATCTCLSFRTDVTQSSNLISHITSCHAPPKKTTCSPKGSS